MSTDTYFRVKIGFKFQSVGKISNISAADSQFFLVNSNTGCRKLEFRLSALTDSDLAWVNGN